MILKVRKAKIIAALLCVGALIVESSKAQLAPEADSIAAQNMKLAQSNEKRLNLLENDFGKWGNLKISGYLQAQWQMAQSSGADAFTNGGNFPANENNRFMVRRGRIKVAYNIGFMTAVFQPDFTEKGVGIKDVYIALKSNNEMWGGQFGLFDRPFGYEISYSSSLRESPERSRVFLSLFPGERDLGAMFNFKWREFTLNAGLFTGNGVAPETDSRKDFIGRLAWLKKMKKSQVGVALSYYNGGVLNGTNEHYTFQDGAGFKRNSNEQYSQFLRQYFGVAAQYKQEWGIGTTTIRAEYLWGNQPGTLNHNAAPKGGIYGEYPSSPTYLRNFRGAYVILNQNIANSKHSITLKYDYYDPNTKISGDEIGRLENTGAADIAYSTFGVGYIFEWTKYLRLMAYYDFIDNEKSLNLADFNTNLKENVLTLRVQVKF